MRLSELLKFDDIVIQCHDTPDADALASGFAVHWYLTKMGKKPRFIYRGVHEVSKDNLIIMLRELEIPAEFVPDFDEKPELLINVDCQHGQKNVTDTDAENIAIIDHHERCWKGNELTEIRSNIGSCATVIWDLLRFEGLDANEDKKLATALYYGLYTDTKRFNEVAHPLDKDMIDSLQINKPLVTTMCNSNISLDELKITGKAILDYKYYPEYRYMIITADKCDPTILGVISDFSMETTDVDVCVAYYISEEEVKFSVRSCTKEVHANEVAAFLAEGIGGGGGHLYKAGGALRPNLIQGMGDIFDIIKGRMDSYYNKYEIIYAERTVLDTSGMKLYEKLPQTLGCVKLSNVYPVGSLVEIRTLEGDINVKIADDMYLMIGLQGEVYPISEEKLRSSYIKGEGRFERTFEYEPSIHNAVTGAKTGVLEYAENVISTAKTKIYARPLTGCVKLFTMWDDEKYYSGEPGDYIAVREDDEHDIYIINKEMFPQLYKEID